MKRSLVLLFAVLIIVVLVFLPLVYAMIVPPNRQVRIEGTISGYSLYENEDSIPVYIHEFSRRYTDTGKELWFYPGKITGLDLPKDTKIQDIQPGTVITVLCPAWDFGMWEQGPCYISK